MFQNKEERVFKTKGKKIFCKTLFVYFTPECSDERASFSKNIYSMDENQIVFM